MPSSRRRVPRTLWLGLAVVLLLSIALTLTAPASVTVEWSTASELNTAGFNLYRGDSPTGPFTRVNAELNAASPDPLVGGQYAFTDSAVSLFRTYYYQLEEVETDGHTSARGTTEVLVSPNPLWPVLILIELLAAGYLLWRDRAAATPPAASHA